MRFSIDHVLALFKADPSMLLLLLPYILYTDRTIINTVSTTPFGLPLLEPLANAITTTFKNSIHLYPFAIPALIGAGFKFNRYLNKRIVDSGIKDKYDWPKEIAIITGGAGAVGSATAEKLLEMGIGAVVLVDVRDPPAELLKSTYPIEDSELR